MEDTGGTSGTLEEKRAAKEKRVRHATDEEKLTSHVRSLDGVATQVTPTGQWSGMLGRDEI